MEIIKEFNIQNRRYLGSKAKLLPFIKKTLTDQKIHFSSFADIFAGTGNVAWAFNDKKTKIIVNDILESNFLSYLSFFGNEEIDDTKLKDILTGYNDTKVVKDNYFSVNFSDTYFSKENCKKIGAIREDIEQKYKHHIINTRERAYLITSLIYAMDHIANTVGHYDAFRSNGDLKKVLHLLPLHIPMKGVNDNNMIFKSNSNDLVKQIKADVVYIDPPYNSRQYCDAYHLLENVATWEKPTVFGVARKMSRAGLKSQYCMNSAPREFDDLIQNIDAKYIIVSYNNMGHKGAGRSQAKIDDYDILSSLRKRGKVRVFSQDFTPFSAGKSQINDHQERLFICFVGQAEKEKQDSLRLGLVKSPLNYTGGKFKLLPQLLSLFPQNYDTFVDLFSGGFNVGANVPCDHVVYNDLSFEVMKLVTLLYQAPYSSVIDQIESVIKHYNLSDTNRNGYQFYGCNSDNGVGHYNRPYFDLAKKSYNEDTLQESVKYYTLLTLVIYSFNNQIRFNSKKEFNLPVGKRDFNSVLRKHVKEFCLKIQKKAISFYNLDFRSMDISQFDNPFVYCDPPYSLGTATYNENDGWTQKDDLDLFAFLDNLNSHQIRFALSNVTEHKGIINKPLISWANLNNYKINEIKANYSNSNYQIINRKAETKEVLITNY